MKQYLKALALLPVFVSILSCSSGNSGGSSSTSTGGSSSSGTVFAQTTYSTASLSGTYSAQWLNISNSDAANLGGFYSGLGTLRFDGAGAITGTMNFYASSSFPNPCVYTLAGTYSLQSTALGTATVKLDTSTVGCTAKPTWQIALAAGDGGAAVKMVRTTDLSVVASGSAVKQ